MIRQLIFGTSIRATDLPEKKHHGDVALAQLLQKAYSSPRQHVTTHRDGQTHNLATVGKSSARNRYACYRISKCDTSSKLQPNKTTSLRIASAAAVILRFRRPSRQQNLQKRWFPSA